MPRIVFGALAVVSSDKGEAIAMAGIFLSLLLVFLVWNGFLGIRSPSRIAIFLAYTSVALWYPLAHVEQWFLPLLGSPIVLVILWRLSIETTVLTIMSKQRKPDHFANLAQHFARDEYDQGIVRNYFTLTQLPQ